MQVYLLAVVKFGTTVAGCFAVAYFFEADLTTLVAGAALMQAALADSKGSTS
jgi:small-conductance mechanosensitive channel